MARVNSYNGPLRTVQGYGAEVARGEVAGATIFGAYGKLTTGGAVVNNIIWPNGAFTFPDQVTGETISFVSSSAQDAVGGTGVSRVEVHYLDVDLQPQSAFITLTGITPVTGQLSGVRFIQCMHVEDVGTDVSAAGLVEAYRATDAAVVFSLIEAGAERCSSSMRMVPAGKRLMVEAAVASSVSGTAAAGTIVEIVATELDNHQYLNPFIWMPHGSIGVQDGSEALAFPSPIPFKAGTIVGMRTTSDKVATITGDWFGILEEV